MGNTATVQTTVVVDKTPPALMLGFGFPANGGVYNTSSWNNGCFGTICGGASDRAGVQNVQVSLQRLATGKYWTGSGSNFSNAAQTFVTTAVFPAGGSSVIWVTFFPAANFPADGQYRLSVRGTDSLGNTTPSGSYLVATFTIDRAPPPAPVINDHPQATDSNKNPHFGYTDSEANVGFRCRLDGAAYTGCNGGADYNNLSDGPHTFCVKAVDQVGNESTATCFAWTIAAGLMDFTMTDPPPAGAKLYPGGPTVPLNIEFTNPNAVPITITGVTVTVTGNSASGSGCSTSAFTVAQQLSATPTVPANSTKSLFDLAVPQNQWPQLAMADSGNQDACKNATVNLSFTGTAQG